MSAFTLACLSCREVFEIEAAQAGQSVRCPHCQAAMPVAPANPASPRWFVARDRRKLGPYSAAQLKQLAAGGGVGPDDMVLREGQPKWVPARAVKGLIAAPAPSAAATLPIARP